MAISINLLPQEFTQAQAKQQKVYKIRLFGVATILTVIFLISLTFALQILQSGTFKRAQLSLNQLEDRVSTFKGQEASLVILKSRLGVIRKLTSTPSKQISLYNLVNSLIPPSFIVSSISTDTGGSVVISAVTFDSLAIDNFTEELSSPSKNGDQITSLAVESLSRGRDGTYRINLKIQGK